MPPKKRNHDLVPYRQCKQIEHRNGYSPQAYQLKWRIESARNVRSSRSKSGRRGTHCDRGNGRNQPGVELDASNRQKTPQKRKVAVNENELHDRRSCALRNHCCVSVVPRLEEEKGRVQMPIGTWSE
jgi:hypothetical protein